MTRMDLPIATMALFLPTGQSDVHRRHPAHPLSVVDSARRGLCTFVGTPPLSQD